MDNTALMTRYARLLGFPELLLLRICLVLCLLALSGCVTLPAGTGLNAPIHSENALPRKAWIGTVKIADDSVKNRPVVEDSLRGNIMTYLQEGGYFLETSSLPGKVAADDLVLDFRFDHYIQKRTPHPAYFPLALVTMTFYIWFGGPIFVDESSLSGVLEIHNGSGKSIGNVISQLHEEHNVSLWSPEYALPSGIKARTSLIQELISKASTDIRNKLTQ